jgi:hypothetical protein
MQQFLHSSFFLLPWSRSQALVMIYTDLYRLIEQDILAMLQSDPVLGVLPGEVCEPGDVASILTDRVLKVTGVGSDGKIGMGYLVLAIENLLDPDPEVPFGALRIPVTVQFVENVVLNRGPNGRNLPLRSAAAYAQKLLKTYWAQNLTTDLAPEKNAIVLFTPDRDDTLRVCQLNFFTFEADPNLLQDLATPMLTTDHPIDPTPGNNVYPFRVTVSASQVGSVYWTTDGSHPWSGNPAAQLWNGNTIQVNGPCLLRVRSFANGYIGSKISSLWFPGAPAGGVPAEDVYPPLPINVVNGQYMPTIDNSGNTLYRPFWDSGTNSIVYLSIRDGIIVLGENPP